MPSELEDQQRVLSEASHDLANGFHRSYYFLDLLADSLDPSGSGPGEQLERLRETLEGIEAIARQTLQYVRPVELRTIRVRLDDLVASLSQHAGLSGVEIGGDAAAGSLEVAVDPTRIAEVLGVLCRDTDGRTGGRLQVNLLGGDPAGLRIARVGATAGKPDLALAVAARTVRLHGGELTLDDGPDGTTPSFILRLPVANPGT